MTAIRTSLFALLSLASLAGCASMGATVDRDKLIETASFDHDCPKERVHIDQSHDDGMSGTGRFVLDVCGKKRKYERLGTLYRAVSSR